MKKRIKNEAQKLHKTLKNQVKVTILIVPLSRKQYRMEKHVIVEF